MHRTKKHTLLLVIALCTLTTAIAHARTIAQFFILPEAGRAIPMLNTMTRMDLMDLHISGIQRPVNTLLKSKTKITQLDDTHMRLCTGDSILTDLYLAVAGKDTTIVAITTLQLPPADSQVKIYDTDWQLTASMPTPPFTLWLTPLGKKEKDDATAKIPFALATATFDTDTGILTFNNTTTAYFADNDNIGAVHRWMLPALHYKIKGKKITKTK